jgi:hypothetical protein
MHGVVNDLRSDVPNLVRGVGSGWVVHAVSHRRVTMPVATRGTCAIDGFVVNTFDDSASAASRAAG